MQTATTFPNGAFPPPPQENTPDITAQIQRQQALYRRIFFARRVQTWWYRILLIVLAGLVASGAGLAVAILGQANLGQAVLKCAIIAVGGSVASVFIFLAVRRVELGLLLVTITATTFFPQ